MLEKGRNCFEGTEESVGLSTVEDDGAGEELSLSDVAPGRANKRVGSEVARVVRVGCSLEGRKSETDDLGDELGREVR